jgi:thiamine-phosphate pyrophosphorylase
MLKPLGQCRLYAFVDAAYLHGRAADTVAEQLCAGGADLIQIRAKSFSEEQVGQIVKKVLPITRGCGVRLVVNDHWNLARETGADLCHLGQEDFFEAGYRKAADLPGFSPPPGLGLSTHSPEQAQRALAAAPDYIAIGPVYATGTKPSAKPVTLEYVRWAAEHVRIPWFAIGGIHLGNLDEVLAAGATRICVVSAILNQDDPAAACRMFKERLAVAVPIP